LAIAAGLLGGGADDHAERAKLRSRLPVKIAGWEGQELPLGDNEVANATDRLLNYDDYIYRVYRRTNQEVYVYAMYWRQGSISVREIAGHTPDGCWISAGARLVEAKRSDSLPVAGRMTSRAEIRTFLFPGNQAIQVGWWHLWADSLVGRDFDRKSIVPTLRELWIWLGQRRGKRFDQVLVRIHTSGRLVDALGSEPAIAFLELFPEVFTATPLR
jgi:hypothetical protein